jgi:hypothetical protein
VEQAVAATIDQGCVTADIALRGERAYSTTDVGRAIAAALSKPVSARTAR